MCVNKISKRVSFVFTLVHFNFLLAQSISVSGKITDENKNVECNVKEINGKPHQLLI